MKELKKYLKKNKLTHKWLSEKIGYSKVYICLVLNKKNKPAKKFFVALSSALKQFAEEKTKEIMEIKCILKRIEDSQNI
jgi:predicted transcriptional regulator